MRTDNQTTSTIYILPASLVNRHIWKSKQSRSSKTTDTFPVHILFCLKAVQFKTKALQFSEIEIHGVSHWNELHSYYKFFYIVSTRRQEKKNFYDIFLRQYFKKPQLFYHHTI